MCQRNALNYYFKRKNLLKLLIMKNASCRNVNFIECSVPDPKKFPLDPDPQVHNLDGS